MSNIEIRLTEHSYVWARPLVFQPAGKKKIFIGNPDTKKFLVADDKWQHLVQILKGPRKVDYIAQRLLEHDPSAFNRHDVISQTKLMLLFLANHGLLVGIDNSKLPEETLIQSSVTSWIPSSAAKIAFHPIALFTYAMAFLFSTVFSISLPALFPRPSDFFWHPQISFNVLSYFFFSWISLFLHELGHIVAARRYGVSSTLRLSTRLLFLVVETKYEDIYKIAPRRRAAIFLAGMGVDFVILAILYIPFALQFAYVSVSAPSIFLLLKQFVLLQWLTIIWQFFFFMKTDIYYIVKELLGIENLYSLATQRIRQWMGMKTEAREETVYDARIISLYGGFVLLGTCVAILQHMLYNVPIMLLLIFLSAQKIFSGVLTENLWLTIDGAIVLFLECLYFSLLAVALTDRKNTGAAEGT